MFCGLELTNVFHLDVHFFPTCYPTQDGREESMARRRRAMDGTIAAAPSTVPENDVPKDFENMSAEEAKAEMELKEKVHSGALRTV